MKKAISFNQNLKLYYVEDKNEKFYLKIIDLTIGFALMLVLFISIFPHII